MGLVGSLSEDLILACVRSDSAAVYTVSWGPEWLAMGLPRRPRRVESQLHNFGPEWLLLM